MYIRDANNDDEGWMLEKLSQQSEKAASFRPRDFRVGIDEDSGERVAFGRIKYHRNTDDREYVEMGSVNILPRASNKQGCLLLVDLAESVEETGQNRVFAFPNHRLDLFEEVGFEMITEDEMPDVLSEEYVDQKELFNTKDVVAMTAQPKNVSFDVEDEKDDQDEKDVEVTEDEIEDIKNDLEIDDSSTYKYST